MKLLTKTYILTLRPFLAVAIAAILTTSCGGTPKKEPLTEMEACDRLNGLITDHPDKFKKYKKGFTRIRNLNSWSVIKVFPQAQECKVWEWSSGLNNYICNWKSKDGREEAQTDYQEAKRIISNCLSDEWQSKTNYTTSGGEHTLFEKPGSKTIVSIRYFRESRGWTKDWHTVLTIGDKSNLKAKTQ
jgi:hypothetical protein